MSKSNHQKNQARAKRRKEDARRRECAATPASTSQPAAEEAYRFAVSKNRNAFAQAKYVANVMEEYWLTEDQIVSILSGDRSVGKWKRESHAGFIEMAVKVLAAADDDCSIVQDFYDPDPSTPFKMMKDAFEDAGPFAAQDTGDDEGRIRCVLPAWDIGCGKVVQVGAPREVLRSAIQKAASSLPPLRYSWVNSAAYGA